MKKFWGYTANDKFSVGCTGQTVYLYDEDGNELKRFRDITYAYTPVISPDGNLFVVKTTDGRLAVYSLETLSLIKKFRFSKVDGAQDDGFCFSPDGKRFINIERQKDSLHSAISVYDTKDFSLIRQVFLGEDKMICHIEYDESTNNYYVLGFIRGKEGISRHGFVAEFKDFEIKHILTVSAEDYNFYRSYKNLEQMGFTEKAYAWSYIKSGLDELKSAKYSLRKLYAQYVKQTVKKPL